MRLANKLAIITGAGPGIGQAVAYLFAQEGAKVVVAQRTTAVGEETVATVKSSGGEAIFIRTDVTIASEVEHLIKVTMDTFGKIDILYNNAGGGPRRTNQPLPPERRGPSGVENVDESAWDRSFATNVKSCFLTAKYAVPHMKKAGGGVIISTGSMSGVRPRLGNLAYASSKGALIVLTKALALELAPYNIRVNCINPVSTDTPAYRRQAAMANISWEERVKTAVSAIPLGRLAKPEDTAYAALYLASDESTMVTGICLDVDGGRGI